jgi:plasmid stability protein
MADGELILRLDDETLRRLREAAAAAGASVEDYAADVLAHSAVDGGVAEDLSILEEYRRTGVSYSVEEGLAAFDAGAKATMSGKS